MSIFSYTHTSLRATQNKASPAFFIFVKQLYGQSDGVSPTYPKRTSPPSGQNPQYRKQTRSPSDKTTHHLPQTNFSADGKTPRYQKQTFATNRFCGTNRPDKRNTFQPNKKTTGVANCHARKIFNSFRFFTPRPPYT